MPDFDPHIDAPLVEAYPELKKFPPLWRDEYFSLQEMDIMLRFVVIFYNPESKSPYEGRADSIYKEIKVPIAVKDAIATQHVGYMEMVVTYLKMLSSYDYEEWCSSRELFHNWTNIMRMRSIDDRLLAQQIKISSELPKLKRRVAELEHRIFPDKATAKLAAGFQEAADLTGFPEKYAVDFFQEIIQKSKK